MPQSRQQDLMHELARLWNADDVEGYLELFTSDIVFLSSENWPETGRWEGKEAMREFWHEFRGVWEDVRLAIDELHDAENAVAARCHWVTRGRVSGMEGDMEFAIVLWMQGDLVVRGQFFEHLPDALEAVGLGDRSRG
jgi:ketosteroid isomerase-like protein